MLIQISFLVFLFLVDEGIENPIDREYIGNTQLNPDSSQKLLGVHIDETLSWNQHIDHLCSIISSRILLLRQLSYYVPENVQKMFYQSYVLPLINPRS